MFNTEQWKDSVYLHGNTIKKNLKKGISDQNKTLKIWKNIATAFQNNLYDALHRLHHPLAFFNTFCKERTEIF